MMIHTENLTKTFGGLTAVSDVSFDVAEGEVFALLGPNGAGKTTMVRMLTSLISRTRGTAEVAGCALGVEAEELRLRHRVGLLPENVGLYEGSSAYQNLEYYGRLQGVEPSALRHNIDDLLHRMELWDHRERPVGGFSKGMKQKVAIARALVHDPVLLFLDEPTANLDPEASKTVRDIILELKKEGRTIFLNTHNLDEAQRICDRVAILRQRLLTIGSPERLKTGLWGSRTALKVANASEALRAAVEARVAPRTVDRDGSTLLVSVDDPDRENSELAEAVLAAGGRLVGLSQLSPSLEDVYLKLVHDAEATG